MVHDSNEKLSHRKNSVAVNRFHWCFIYLAQLVSAREKFEQLQKGLEAEINRLRNQANDDDKYIASLKEQV